MSRLLTNFIKKIREDDENLVSLILAKLSYLVQILCLVVPPEEEQSDEHGLEKDPSNQEKENPANLEKNQSNQDRKDLSSQEQKSQTS